MCGEDKPHVHVVSDALFGDHDHPTYEDLLAKVGDARGTISGTLEEAQLLHERNKAPGGHLVDELRSCLERLEDGLADPD
jgi:hypothetical protein